MVVNLTIMLIRNTRKAVRESSDEMNLKAPFVSVLAPSNNWDTISAAIFMAATVHIGDIP